jgi:hypothetical protein
MRTRWQRDLTLKSMPGTAKLLGFTFISEDADAT